ncbi:MAG TPA: hypothetical protein VFT85_06480 [Acidimicrobiia bacterium]|nr:hypothetical protein [Acidimicrobiia bacterium]
MTDGAGGSSPSGANEAVDVDRLIAENEALRANLDRRLVWRKVLTWLLVVLTSLGVVSSTIAIWAHQTVFDTDRFMETLDPALDDPALYAVLGDRASTSVLEALDLDARVTEALSRLDDYLSQALLDAIELDQRALDLLSRFDRPSLDALAPPIVESLETRITDRIEGFFASEAFVSRFPEVVRRTHEVTIALVRDELEELPNVYIAEGEVRLNLIPFITEALRSVVEDLRGFLPDIDLPAIVSDRLDEGRQQLADAIQAELPEDFGQVTVMSEDALGEVQAVAERLDRFVWLIVLGTILMAALTIALSPARRRTAVHLALGVVIGIAIALVVIRRLESAIVAQVTTPDGSEAARVLLGRVFSSLRSVQWVVAIGAAVVGIVAYLAGRPAWVTRVTATARSAETSEWVAGHHDALRLAGIAVAVVVFFIVGLELWAVALIAVVLAGYLWLIGSIAEGSGAGDGSDTEMVPVVDGDGPD